MDKIELEGLEFYAYHGFYNEERKIGCHYIVNLELFGDLSAVLETDNLDDTINYSEIYRTVKAEMEISSKMIEHVAGRIVIHILRDFSKVQGVKIKISKINPSVGGKLKSAGVILERWRNR